MVKFQPQLLGSINVCADFLIHILPILTVADLSNDVRPGHKARGHSRDIRLHFFGRIKTNREV